MAHICHSILWYKNCWFGKEPKGYAEHCILRYVNNVQRQKNTQHMQTADELLCTQYDRNITSLIIIKLIHHAALVIAGKTLQLPVHIRRNVDISDQSGYSPYSVSWRYKQSYRNMIIFRYIVQP